MHGVGLVHRDIKLESTFSTHHPCSHIHKPYNHHKDILLTTQIFSSLTPTSPRPTLDTLPLSPKPLIKLADFGLSRFIKVDEATGQGELLWTRCGSEAYAAPELVMGTGSVRAQARPKLTLSSSTEEQEETVRGFYDARETDAWACGVVLYALVARRLPFGEGVDDVVVQNGDARVMIGGDGAPGHGHGRTSLVERRLWLLKIARGEYEWPTINDSDETRCDDDDTKELVGQELIQSRGVKRITARLLVRDPRKRAKIMDLWEDGWMWGVGGGLTVGMTEDEWRWREKRDDGSELKIFVERSNDEEIEVEIDEERFLDEGMVDEDEVEVFEEVVDGEEGCLLDQEGIGSVASQEMV